VPELLGDYSKGCPCLNKLAGVGVAKRMENSVPWKDNPVNQIAKEMFVAITPLPAVSIEENDIIRLLTPARRKKERHAFIGQKHEPWSIVFDGEM
jgi:hypothetical protein